MKKIQIISIFPEMFPSVLESSMLFKAKDIGVVDYNYINLRDYGLGPRRQVDDVPYGGGDGMLLKPEPLFGAIEQAKKIDPSAKVYFMGPRGEKLKQSMSKELADSNEGMIIVCGRYEGIDERVMSLVDRTISIGDYILTGGEVAAMVLIDSIVRLMPGVLGGVTSAEKESFSEGQNLEHPHYTRPEVYNEMRVPEVLLSGNHAEIEKWRRENADNVS